MAKRRQTKAEILAELETLRREHEALRRRLSDNGATEEEAFTDLALDAQLDTFFLFDPTAGKAIRWNRAFREISGYTDDEIAELPAPATYYGPADLERAESFISEVLETGTGTIELGLICKDGRKIPTEYRVSVVKDESGAPKYLISIGRDITEHKRAEAEILRQQYYLEKAQELGHIGTWEINLIEGNIHWTDENCRIFGVPPGSVVDYEFFLSRVHPDDRKHVHREWGAALTGKPYDIEHRLVPNPEVRWVREKAELTFDENGKAVGAIGVTQDITQRKEAEQALIGQLVQSQQYLDVAGVMIIAIDRNQRVTLINPKGTEILACPKRDILGKNWFDSFVPPEQRETVKQVFDQIMADELAPVEYYENTVLARNGARREIAWHNALLRAPDGTIIGTLSSGEDITERKRAEDEIQKREELLNATGEMARVGGWEIDLETNTVIWTRATRMIHEVPDDYVPTLDNALDFFPDEARQTISEAVTRAREQGVSYDLELPFVTARGRRRWTRAVGRSEMKAGQCVRLHGTFQDITARRKAENERRESEERLKAIFESSPDYLMLLDRQHRVLMLNRASSRLTVEQMTGKPPYDFMPPEGRAGVKAHLERVIGASIPQEWNTVYENPEGCIVHFNSVAAPVMVDGKTVGSVVSSRDITEHKKLETDKRELEEQFRQSQKMEAIGRLAGGIAHDFNNLLTVIDSYAEFVMDDLKEADPMRADIKQIQDAGQRAISLVRQLLAFSRRQIMEPRVIDLNRVVTDLEKMMVRLIGEDIALQCTLSPDLGRVSADPGQIEQVLMNLAVNARDAMPEGGTLTIETRNAEIDETQAAGRPDTRPGPYVLLAVTDSGVGIPAEERDRIFEPFYTTKEKGKGTGLGLSMVYGIVKQSGGNIWVYSEPGRGTTFKVYLPQADETDTPRMTPPPRSEKLNGDETILVVEDEEAVRHLARRILSSAGYRVITAANGGEALLECEGQGGDVDLILTDVVMPKMSGRELAERLGKVCTGLKVLYMSGYTDDAIVRHGVLEAGTAFVAKPFNTRELLRKVRTVLDNG